MVYERLAFMTAAECLQQLHDKHSMVMTLEGRASGGEVGAYFARAENGERFVFKWSNVPADHAYYVRVVERIDLLRRSQYPIPEYLNPFPVPGGVIVLQRAVDGTWSDVVGHELVDSVLLLSDLQADLTTQTTEWSDYIRGTLLEGADGYCVHDSLRTHNDRTRQLLNWVEAVGKAVAALPSRDVVHVDFHHRNLLRVDGRLSAVIDWEGCAWGDRAFDLVTFSFGLSEANTEPGVEQRIWNRAQEIASNDSLRAYVAHMSLRRVDWTIRHHPEDLDNVLGYSERLVHKVA